MVEAAGVELSSVLTARNNIDSRKGHNGEKGHIGESLVRLFYENVFVLGPAAAT